MLSWCGISREAIDACPDTTLDRFDAPFISTTTTEESSLLMTVRKPRAIPSVSDTCDSLCSLLKSTLSTETVRRAPFNILISRAPEQSNARVARFRHIARLSLLLVITAGYVQALSFDNRLSSFNNNLANSSFPDSLSQEHRVQAAAGFWRAPGSNKVVCFACGISPKQGSGSHLASCRYQQLRDAVLTASVPTGIVKVRPLTNSVLDGVALAASFGYSCRDCILAACRLAMRVGGGPSPPVPKAGEIIAEINRLQESPGDLIADDFDVESVWRLACG